ncbi:Gamma-glutamyl-gamma-aminobutyrate hydrolase family protein, partial [Dysosmobacter welbionis]
EGHSQRAAAPRAPAAAQDLPSGAPGAVGGHGLHQYVHHGLLRCHRNRGGRGRRPGQQRGGDRQQEQQPGGLPHLRQDHRRPGGRRQGLHHCGGGLRRGRHYLRLHHGDGPGLQAVEHNRQPLRRPHDYRPGADHALLHRAGHGRADHRQLLHHGGHLRSHPDGSLHRCHQDGGPLLRVLLRHCGGHHAAGGPGGLCRQRHCQGGSHEDRVQRHETGHS